MTTFPGPSLDSFSPTSVFLALFSICVVAFVVKSQVDGRRYPLPPGPKGLPILGNIFQTSKPQWLQFTRWKEEFGPIFSLNLAGQRVIVLNTHQVASDLLDRRSSIYSDRPRWIMAGEIMTAGMWLPLQPYGDLWRRMRKAAHEGLNIRAAEAYQPLQEAEAATLIEGLIKDPDSWDDHIQRTAASVVKGAIYGSQPIESKDDPLVNRINDVIHRISLACMPGAYLVELFPIMLYLPAWIAPWKRYALDCQRKDSIMLQEFMDEVKAKVDQGIHKPCFASNLYLNTHRNQLTYTQEAYLAGVMFAGGSDTTSAALSVFMLAMRLYPDVMKKAQSEIDAVVGRDRLPSSADKPNLPYIRATVKEVLRWRTVAPLGLPRRVVYDDYYNGYFIPKGAIVIPNIYAMNRDPKMYPDHDEFRPERFPDESGTVEVVPPGTHMQGHVSFGFGRRTCSGLNVANQALFIDIASILWAATIEPAFDSEGKMIVPSKSDHIDLGIVVLPVPFQCKIVPRSTDVDSMLAVVKEKQAW